MRHPTHTCRIGKMDGRHCRKWGYRREDTLRYTYDNRPDGRTKTWKRMYVCVCITEMNTHRHLKTEVCLKEPDFWGEGLVKWRKMDRVISRRGGDTKVWLSGVVWFTVVLLFWGFQCNVCQVNMNNINKISKKTAKFEIPSKKRVFSKILKNAIFWTVISL